MRVFFYGSFINRDVLAASGLIPERVEVARLWGFDISIQPLANLVRSDECCVYGIVCEAFPDWYVSRLESFRGAPVRD